MEIGKIAFDIVFKLIMEILKSAVKIDDLPFLQRKKIEARLDSSIAEVVGPLVPFLQREGLSPDRSRLLLESCAREFESLMENPVIFFQGGLDGQKIFDALVTKRKVPQELLDEGLVDQYYLFGPRIATVLCQFPAAVRGWETEAWAENYRRLEDISIGIRELFLKVDHMVSRELVGSDELIVRLRRASYQRTTLDYDLTGLRSERPVLGKFDNFFVHPLLSDDDGLRHDTSWKPTVIGDAVNSSGEFISKRNRSIIVASAGSGKSTWTKWLQLEALSGNWGGICLRIELRGFSEKLKLSLGDLIRLEAGVHLADEVTTPVTRQWINRGLVLLILDGFDEIRTGERDSVLHWITELATTNQYCSIIATTRPLTTEHEQQFITQGW